MNKQRGFTLIELVVVIVILGILAVTAAPRFLNLQSDARVSALQGMKGAMAGAGSIVYGKAAINGVETAISGAIDNGNQSISIVYGYPEASSAGIGNAVQGLEDGTEWQLAENGNEAYVTFADRAAPDGSDCSVVYKNAEDQFSTPQITVVETGC
ncbi:prepilin-type N-terminal cleavage/methylation domain-containing protein [Vibrio breoganii]|uniref:prepilin-type N-terminal cleavage/methylation domain-containing protein n=1 Tax=Vibrio breoganii TaxID=553239 RepID=UPI0021C2E02A|nr:prepilin-type N-terminal cleavage/methylation domain-containing protein [Vibrio breoganii]MDN3717332.1 type II secretion system protein [Vibrio breoganii]